MGEFETVTKVVFVVVGTTFLAYLLNIAALGMVEPTVVNIYIYLQPLIVTGVSIGLTYMGYTHYSEKQNQNIIGKCNFVSVG